MSFFLFQIKEGKIFVVIVHLFYFPLDYPQKYLIKLATVQAIFYKSFLLPKAHMIGIWAVPQNLSESVKKEFKTFSYRFKFQLFSLVIAYDLGAFFSPED